MAFQKATKKQAKARIALIGPSGSGKTFSALRIAQGLGNSIAVIDTERGSASKYAHRFEFDTNEIDNYHPETYIKAIHEAEQAGYDVLIIDSLSHAWMGKDGALELVDRAAARMKSSNSFAAWRDVTPIHNKLVDTIISARLHIIATMRSKTEYVQERNEQTGKQVIRKVGTQAIQREGFEYEFDIVGDMDLDHNLIISKTRCELLDGKVYNLPSPEFGKVVLSWLSDGSPSYQGAIKAIESELDNLLDAPLPKAQPAPQPTEAKSTPTDIPNSPKLVMQYVANILGVDYYKGNANHLSNAVGAFPPARDLSAWADYAPQALEHARLRLSEKANETQAT